MLYNYTGVTLEWKNKSRPPRNGVMTKVLVYEHTQNALIGTGWIIFRDDGKHSVPDLWDIMGNRLPEGCWYNLVLTDETRRVVIPRMVQ